MPMHITTATSTNTHRTPRLKRNMRETMFKTLALSGSRFGDTIPNAGLILGIRIFIWSKRIRGAPSLHSETSTNSIFMGDGT